MSEKTKINAKIRWVPRHGTLKEWEKSNPILLSGEIGIVTDGTAGEFQKVGDGVTHWKDLPWKSGPQGIQGEKGEKGEKGEDNPAYTKYDELRQKCEEAATDATNAANDAASVREEIKAGGFIESIKEQNDGEKFSVWVGTREEYDAIAEKDNNCLYIVEDDEPFTVDEVYDSASLNPQSGKAVAEAIAPVDKKIGGYAKKEELKNLIGCGSEAPKESLSCLFYVQYEEE